ncbi:hypothetical protein NFI96_009827 [Prochilodus magdalenae]|nr:hypothetical protein NFI96_009827 [Prochilodus magdalenae]
MDYLCSLCRVQCYDYFVGDRMGRCQHHIAKSTVQHKHQNHFCYNFWSWNPNKRGHDDTIVEWNSWYRLFFQGADAQILEGCVSYMQCGGFTSLWLGKSHPQIEDCIVTQDVYLSRTDKSYGYRCDNHKKSNPIQVCGGVCQLRQSSGARDRCGKEACCGYLVVLSVGSCSASQRAGG